MAKDPLAFNTDDTYLGFDFGNKKIGVAVGQRITATASPLQTLRSPQQRPRDVYLEPNIQSYFPGYLNKWESFRLLEGAGSVQFLTL